MSRAKRFLRLRTSILDSSLLLEPLPTRWLWLTMLILADDAGTGIVDMPIERLAVQAGLSVSQTRIAIERLCAPDPLSRSPRAEGRRLTPLDRAPGMEPRGWSLVNWEDEKKEAEREATAARVARHRARKPEENDECNGDVTASNDLKHEITPDPEERQSRGDVDTDQREGERGASAPTPAPSSGNGHGKGPGKKTRFVAPTPTEVRAWMEAEHPDWLRTVNPVAFCAHYESKGWRVGKSPMTDWQAAVVTWVYRT